MKEVSDARLQATVPNHLEVIDTSEKSDKSPLLPSGGSSSPEGNKAASSGL